MNNKSAYVLEDQAEFDRLEKQSSSKNYNFWEELRFVNFEANTKVLDAGCGSGIVSRALAHRHSDTSFIGCDFSRDRIEQAMSQFPAQKNLKFLPADLTQTPFANSSFDTVICRYVLEHLPADTITQVLSEFKRILKPGGTLYIIDVDGFLLNLYPATPVMQECFDKLRALQLPDLEIGRKLPSYLSAQDFQNVSWHVDTINCTEANLQEELILMREKFTQAKSLFTQLLGSEIKAQRFSTDYFQAAQTAGAVLFYNKFLITAKNPAKVNS